jgi:hypothetical protein
MFECCRFFQTVDFIIVALLFQVDAIVNGFLTVGVSWNVCPVVGLNRVDLCFRGV